jgi:hypothetical protein
MNGSGNGGKADALPPSVGDILIAARTRGWPRITYGADTIDGEPAWRRYVESLSPDERLQFWRWMGSRRQETNA